MNQSPYLARLQRLAPLLLVLISTATTVAAYLQALDYPFVADDTHYVTENTKLAGLHLSELWRLFTKPYNNYAEFYPLRDLSYWLDMALFGLNPAAFRLHNILLYLLCLPLVYATTLELWRYFRPADTTSAPWAAATVTALFVLHPAHVETVVWISMRKYVLPNLFSMLALWLAVRARRVWGLSVPHAAMALAAFMAVILSYESYIAVAPVIALLWVVFWLDIPKPERCRSQLLWPLAILFLAIFLHWLGLNRSAEGERTLEVMPFYFGIEAVTKSLAIQGWLARLAVSPESRHFFYPVFEYTSLPVMVVLGVVVLVAGTAGMVMLLRKRSLESFALAAFLLLCLTFIQLIPVTVPSPVSDHWLTLALWPAILLLVALSWRLKPISRTVLLLAIALPWGFQTIERPRDWRSLETLLNTDLRTYPGHYLPALYKIVGIPSTYREANETANSITTPEFRDIMVGIIDADYAVNVDAVSTGKPQEAMVLLWELVLDLSQPPEQTKWNSPAHLFWEKSKEMLASKWVDLGKHFPDDVSVRYQYINAVAYLRSTNESQQHPESVRGAAFYYLGLALINSGHVAEAEAPLRAALEQSPPDLRAHCLLSEVYKQAKRIEETARAEANCPDARPIRKQHSKTN